METTGRNNLSVLKLTEKKHTKDISNENTVSEIQIRSKGESTLSYHIRGICNMYRTFNFVCSF